MAKPIKLSKGKEFNFGKTGVTTKYPWTEWFNGDLLMIEHSDIDSASGAVIAKKDYDVPTDAMPPKIKTAARKRYKICMISRHDADGVKLNDALIIRARDMTADERQAEDLKRAEEKAALAAAAAAPGPLAVQHEDTEDAEGDQTADEQAAA